MSKWLFALLVAYDACALTACAEPESQVMLDAPIACELCNGPGCEDLDAACQDVESNSRAILCWPGETKAPNEFSTKTPQGRWVDCRCGTEDCGP